MKKLLLISLIFISGITSVNAQSIKLGMKIGANFSKLDGTAIDGGTKQDFTWVVY